MRHTIQTINYKLIQKYKKNNGKVKKNITHL